MRLIVEERDYLDDQSAAAVRALAGRAPGAVDNPPLSEQVLLQLSRTHPVHHAVALTSEEVLVGYAQLDTRVNTVELVTQAEQPMSVALALFERLLPRAAQPGEVHLWAHGPASVAAELAYHQGWKSTRRLLQMRLDLTARQPAGPPEITDSITIRPFDVNSDRAAWLALNAGAFAHHPEQGGWTDADLDARLAAAWFDPAGFLVAERGADLVGFHWTKIHWDSAPPIGEVYVLGIDARVRGHRLGKRLLNAGLDHLRARQLSSVLLYVEDDNEPAVRLYEKAGFSTFSTDTQYVV